jgi:hypothetical protein
MNEKHIAQLEAQLEKLTEGLFARFFGQRIQAHDIALQLVRALESELQPPRQGDARPIAPDRYTIHLSPVVLEYILDRYPTLTEVLGSQIVELASHAGYRLSHNPQVNLVADPALANQEITIGAGFHRQQSSTAAKQPVPAADHHPQPINPQLIISGQRVVPLSKAIIQIGRHKSNDIALDDAFASRTHAQLRLRFGHYMIFDTDSQSGTYVNNVQIREHRLQSGDVIRIGKTSLVYMEDDLDLSGATDALTPVS